jgi:hypothetical protein
MSWEETTMHTNVSPAATSLHLSLSAPLSERLLTGYWKTIWAATGGCLLFFGLAQLLLRLDVEYTL